MRRFTIAASMILPALCSLLIARGGGSKPYTRWSAGKVVMILTDSPWARTIGVGWRDRDDPYRYYPFIYHVNLLTARPVREAVLRSIALDQGASVRLGDLLKKDREAEQARLEEFVASNPDSLVVKGDKEHIVVSLILKKPGRLLPGKILNEPSDGEFSAIDAPKLIADARLETDSGKQLKVSRYEPPGKDRLGAKFFFERKLPDCSPFIAAGDRELRFETSLNDRKLKVKFDLKKMRYKGKLEF
jgi:hypothetical protein